MKTIHQYVKRNVNGNKQIVGVLLGGMGDDKIIRIGWSKTAVSRGDRFDRDRGMKIAEGRMTRSVKGVTVPHSMKKDAKEFRKRCRRYFQDSQGTAPVSVINHDGQAVVIS